VFALTAAVGIFRTLAVFAAAGLLASPAQAAVPSMALPDPSGLTLFALGVAGLLIGRHIAGKPRD
jgi:hypothetical protein